LQLSQITTYLTLNRKIGNCREFEELKTSKKVDKSSFTFFSDSDRCTVSYSLHVVEFFLHET